MFEQPALTSNINIGQNLKSESDQEVNIFMEVCLAKTNNVLCLPNGFFYKQSIYIRKWKLLMKLINTINKANYYLSKLKNRISIYKSSWCMWSRLLVPIVIGSHYLSNWKTLKNSKFNKPMPNNFRNNSATEKQYIMRRWHYFRP